MDSENKASHDPQTESSTRIQSLPTGEQFLILARKVEELEDRVRSLAVNDLGKVRRRIDNHDKAIRNLKSPSYWIGGVGRRLRQGFGRVFNSGS